MLNALNRSTEISNKKRIVRHMMRHSEQIFESDVPLMKTEKLKDKAYHLISNCDSSFPYYQQVMILPATYFLVITVISQVIFLLYQRMISQCMESITNNCNDEIATWQKAIHFQNTGKFVNKNGYCTC